MLGNVNENQLADVFNVKIQCFCGNSITATGRQATHLDSVVTYIDFLGIVRTAIAWSICNAIAEKFAQYGIRRGRLPRDVHRGGGRVMGRRRYRFARGRCK